MVFPVPGRLIVHEQFLDILGHPRGYFPSIKLHVTKVPRNALFQSMHDIKGRIVFWFRISNESNSADLSEIKRHSFLWQRCVTYQICPGKKGR